MSIPVGVDEALSKLYYNWILGRYVRHVYEKKTGKIKRLVRYVKIIMTYRTDYLNPKRLGHRIMFELTASKSVEIGKLEEEKETMKAEMEARYSKICEEGDYPDLKANPNTATSIQTDYEEDTEERPYSEEAWRCEH